MEQVHPREAAREQEEDVGLDEALAGWEGPDLERALAANVFAHHVGLLPLINQGCHATSSTVSTAEPQW
jgi:hypothetical protein